MRKEARVLIQSGKAVSLNEVARQIGYVGEKLGLEVILNRDYPTVYDIGRVADALILVYPSSPTYSLKYYLLYRDAVKVHGVPAVYYTTTEGPPKPFLVPPWAKRDVEFVACSRYVASCLRRAGLRVRSVVHHGVLWAEVEAAEEQAVKYAKLLSNKFGDKVRIACVASNNPRKALDRLAEAVAKLSEKRDDFVVLLVSSKDAIELTKKVKNMVFVGEFGSRDHVEVLGFLGACDYLVLPSVSEGFALPVLESMAMARPVIHCDLPPVMEYASPDSNFIFQHSEKRYVDTDEGVFYEYFLYDPSELASAVEEAIECKKQRPSEYADRCAKAREAASKYKSEDLYKKLFDMIGAA